MSFEHNYVQVDGVEMHYVREGEGFPLFLIHGWPEYWRTWRKNIPVLADAFDVIVPDLVGFGKSENPNVSNEEGYGVEAHAADITAFADALDITEFGFVSHDLGAYVGQRLARERPSQVRGLFFFDCPYPGIGERWRDPDHIGEIWYQSFNQQPWAADLVGTNRETCRIYIEHFLDHWAHEPGVFSETDREAWVETFSESGNLEGGFNWYVAAEEDRKRLMREGAPAMEPIDVPTRILWGESDPILNPEWTDRLGEYFDDYQLDIAPDAGHFVHYERPELANESIESFFGNIV